MYTINTCGAWGSEGPKSENCLKAYKHSTTNVAVLDTAPWAGIQRWTVPESGYYTWVLNTSWMLLCLVTSLHATNHAESHPSQYLLLWVLQNGNFHILKGLPNHIFWVYIYNHFQNLIKSHFFCMLFLIYSTV